MSRTLFLFLVKFLYVLILIRKQKKYSENSDLSVLSVLDLARYAKQLSYCHSSVIIQAKYNISLNQLFTVLFKDASN
jgi:hypothetical protein